MKTLLSLIPLFLALNSFGQVREKQKPLFLKDDRGTKVIIEYSSESFQESKLYGINVHIEEIFVLTDNFNWPREVDVFINGERISLTCRTGVCSSKSDPGSFEKSLYSQNIFFHIYRSKPKMKDVYASFLLDRSEWLFDPVYQSSNFLLRFKFP